MPSQLKLFKTGKSSAHFEADDDGKIALSSKKADNSAQEVKLNLGALGGEVEIKNGSDSHKLTKLGSVIVNGAHSHTITKSGAVIADTQSKLSNTASTTGISFLKTGENAADNKTAQMFVDPDKFEIEFKGKKGDAPQPVTLKVNNKVLDTGLRGNKITAMKKSDANNTVINRDDIQATLQTAGYVIESVGKFKADGAPTELPIDPNTVDIPNLLDLIIRLQMRVAWLETSHPN